MDISSSSTNNITAKTRSSNDGNGEEESDYFLSFAAREEELRKLNEELDLKLTKVAGGDTNQIFDSNTNKDKEEDVHRQRTNSYTSSHRDKEESLDKMAMESIEEEDDDDEFNNLMSLENIMASFSTNESARSSASKENKKKRRNRPENMTGQRPENMAGQDNGLDNLLTGFDQSSDDATINNSANYTKQQDKSKIEKKISSTAQHLQNVKIKALSKNLRQAIDSKSNLSKSNNELEAKVKKIQEMNRTLQLQVSRMQMQITKKTDECKYNQNQIDDLRSENANLKKEVSSLRSIVKECESDSRSNEMRLKRALESVEKFKSMVMEYKSRSDEDESSRGKIQKEYDLKLKQIKKQKEDLLAGFKKQMQLINVLKRQKLHLEASRMLDFTEQEFMKVLDWQHNPNTKGRSTKNSII